MATNKQYTFSEIAGIWCDAKRQIVKHSTMCAYLLCIKTHLLPRFGSMTVITETEVQRFVFDKIAEGLSKKTVRDIVAVLKSIVKYGCKHGICPFSEWDIKYPKGSEFYRLPVLSLTSHKKLMRYLTDTPTPQNIGVLLSLCTGMRIGEVCALKWEDVDMKQRIITVGATTSRIYNCELHSTEKIRSTPKTRNSFREIPISGQLYQALKAVKRESKTQYVVGLTSTEPRAYRDFFYRLLKRLDIPKIKYHGLRHSFATRCVESKCDYKTLSSILGHSNIVTTLNLYVHPNIDQKKGCIERMFKYLH